MVPKLSRSRPDSLNSKQLGRLLFERHRWEQTNAMQSRLIDVWRIASSRRSCVPDSHLAFPMKSFSWTSNRLLVTRSQEP